MRAALLQLDSGNDQAANLRAIAAATARAVAAGAELVVLPEAATYRGPFASEHVQTTDGPVVAALAALAAEHRVILVLGGIWLASADPVRPYNSCLVFGRDGTIAAHYDKVHLFRLDTPERVEDEAACTTAGDRLVVVTLDELTVGLSICYDLRFPEQYRALEAAGARLLLVPANFSAVTGPDHWRPLLTARAVENLCYVLAPAQTGTDRTGFVSHGHSLAVDPWGRTLAEAGTEPEMLVVELDPAEPERARSRLRSPDHVRPEAYRLVETISPKRSESERV